MQCGPIRYRVDAEQQAAARPFGHIVIAVIVRPTNSLAVELDGPQHLADPEACRRDRSKDSLLPENGCFVLRFLAQDVGKNLDGMLDTILRAMSHQNRR